MTGRYLTDLADVCRRAGLSVVEVDGWQTRARSSGGYATGRPICIMWHHTASVASPESDVNYIISASDAPLSNLYLARDGSVWICAAGATNTNGKGGPLTFSRGTVPVDQMNVHAIGIEAANSGTGEMWPRAQIDAFFALSNALAAAYGLQPTDLASHAAWAPQRKIDPATAAAVENEWRPRSINSAGTWNLDDMRAEAAARADNAIAPPTPDPKGDMMWIELQIVEAGAIFMGYRVGDWLPQVEWVNGDDPRQLARYENYKRAGMETMSLSVTDCSGITLLGPIPTGDARWNWSRESFGNVIG